MQVIRDQEKTLVFCQLPATTIAALRLVGVDVVTLGAFMTPEEREAVVTAFTEKDNEAMVLVVTYAVGAVRLNLRVRTHQRLFPSTKVPNRPPSGQSMSPTIITKPLDPDYYSIIIPASSSTTGLCCYRGQSRKIPSRSKIQHTDPHNLFTFPFTATSRAHSRILISTKIWTNDAISASYMDNKTGNLKEGCLLCKSNWRIKYYQKQRNLESGA